MRTRAGARQPDRFRGPSAWWSRRSGSAARAAFVARSRGWRAGALCLWAHGVECGCCARAWINE